MPVELRLKRSIRPLAGAQAPAVSRQATEERDRLEAERMMLRETEDNLRGYEAQLRAMQAEMDGRRENDLTTSVSSVAPGELSLQSEWDKLTRARELIDSEQASFRDDRMVLKADQAALRRQQVSLAAREAALSAREQALIAAAEPIAAEKSMSVITRLARTPFEFARAVFRIGK